MSIRRNEKASEGAPSWYLDSLVAAQKQEVHTELARRWSKGLNAQTVLKTDLFEEAFGHDSVLLEIAPEARHATGIDIAEGTVAKARRRFSRAGFYFVTGDVRRLPFPDNTFDLVFSNSTLDHFQTVSEVHASLHELVRVNRPGGLIIVTLDNPSNPLYYPLRTATQRGWTPFALGCTLSDKQLNASLEQCGMEVLANDWLIHNPRLISTALFLALRRALGERADAPIRGLLKSFGVLGRLPLRRFTACFVAVCARKRAS